jgi:hypothetical protein
MRTLKKQHLISHGVQVAKRGQHGLEGAASYHSVLSAWAARLQQAGKEREAENLGAVAAQIEEGYEPYLRAFLSHHPLAELDRADFFPRLVHDTAAAFANIEVRTGLQWIFARATEQRGATWHLEGHTPAGEQRSADVLAQMMQQRNIGRGSWVILINRMLGGTALTEVERAVPAPSENEIAEGPPYRDEEYVELAARYRRTSGALPTPEQSEQLQRAHEEGQLPRRSLHPSG